MILDGESGVLVIDPDENVYPMIPAGAAHYDMKLGPDDEIDEQPEEEGMVLV